MKLLEVWSMDWWMLQRSCSGGTLAVRLIHFTQVFHNEWRSWITNLVFKVPGAFRASQQDWNNFWNILLEGAGKEKGRIQMVFQAWWFKGDLICFLEQARIGLRSIQNIFITFSCTKSFLKKEILVSSVLPILSRFRASCH